MKKRDIIVIAIGLAVLLVLWMAPPETTHRMPRNSDHQRFYDIIDQQGMKQGRKEAEKFCQDCHNPEQVPFPAEHPAKFRCLFCHKLLP